MMCLGWSTRPKCEAREPQVVAAPGSMCPDITWFWVALAAIGIGAVSKKA
jgi:hypothetical protein